MSKLSLRHPDFLLLEGTNDTGVIPPSRPFGMAITQNSDGNGPVDFWNLTPGTHNSEGFYFHQKFGDGTEKTFLSTYWFSDAAELDLMYDMSANQFLNLAVHSSGGWINVGGGVPEFAIFMNDGKALTLNADLSVVIGGTVSQGAVNPNASFQGIASLSDEYNEIAVYGDHPATNKVVAIGHDNVGGYLYTDSDRLNISATALVRFTSPVEFALISSAVPANNGDLVVQATSNTQLTFKYKGSDGVVRSASLTLS
jgi:hypothetical protein